jgi:GNAT superfamily N-acetyltransferase
MHGMRYEITTLMQGADICRELFDDAMREAGTPGEAFLFRASTYQALDRGASFAVVAFDGDTVTGFASVFVSNAMHYDGKVASSDVIYVCPAYRNSLVTGRLMALSEREAKRRGAKSFQWAANDNSPLDKTLAGRSSYRLFQKIFVKEL